MMRRILTLDLGTKLGVAYNPRGSELPTPGHIILGTKKEITQWGKTRENRRSDPRVTRLFTWLWNFISAQGIEIVVFEDVQFSSSTYQTQLWSSFRGAVWAAVAMSGNTPIVECVPTGTLKKFATGHGGATKKMMGAAFYRLRPDVVSGSLSEDEIDALWLWMWAKQHLALA